MTDATAATSEPTLMQIFAADSKAWREGSRTEPCKDWTRIYEWERNGAWDSDWYSVILHIPTGRLLTVESGTTRYANALHLYHGFFAPLTAESLEVARAALLDTMARQFSEMDQRRVSEPEPSEFTGPGKRVKITAPTGRAVQTFDFSQCEKCGGTGVWKGRKGAEGACFACHEIGGRVCKSGKTRRLQAGETGVTLDKYSWFGTQYSNGYNRPSRSNSRVLVKWDDGTVTYVALSTLSLDRSAATYEDKVAEHKERCMTMDPSDGRWAQVAGVVVF